MDLVWRGVPESFLEERRRLGLDHRDELWEGVLHMVPPPSFQHNDLTSELWVFLRRVLRARGLGVHHDPMGVFAPDLDPQSWRVPDISIARPDQVSVRGLEGAVVVVEVLSPHDESRDKFEFYARVGVEEVWLVDPHSRAVEIYVRPIDSSTFARVDAMVSPRLGVAFAITSGPRLRVSLDDESVEL